jgi:hypothetical protein
MRNFNRKPIYSAPILCMYCQTCYNVKPGFNSSHPSHGICDACLPNALKQAKGE